MRLVERARRRRRDFFSDKDRIVLSLYLPALNRIERGSAKGFAGSQAEAGVMPWATYFIAHNQAFSKRPMIVSAKSTHREELCALSHQQDILRRHDSLQLSTVRETVDGNPLAEIRLL